MTFYLGQIELFGFNYAPAGWAPCNGQIMPIMQNQALFSLLGTTYGGNGATTFALPNMHPVSPAGPHYFIYINAQAATFPTR